MSKLTEKDMEELRETCAYDCEFSGTQEIVEGITEEALKELGSELFADEVILSDCEDSHVGTLEDFVRIFWDKAVEKILNVVSTQ